MIVLWTPAVKGLKSQKKHLCFYMKLSTEVYLRTMRQLFYENNYRLKVAEKLLFSRKLPSYMFDTVLNTFLFCVQIVIFSVSTWFLRSYDHRLSIKIWSYVNSSIPLHDHMLIVVIQTQCVLNMSLFPENISDLIIF